MTRIDFYQIDSRDAPLDFTCRLIDKIYHRGHRIHIHTNDISQSEALDDLLWSFRPDRFIPHSIFVKPGDAGTKDEAEQQDLVKISHEAEPDHQDILINISGTVPDFFSRFDRVAEVVPLDKNSRETARVNFKFYKDRGYPLRYHALKQRAEKTQ